MKANDNNSATIDTANALFSTGAQGTTLTELTVDTANTMSANSAVSFSQDTIVYGSTNKGIDIANGTIEAREINSLTVGNSLTLLGIENNANKDVSIEFQSNGNTLTLNNQLTLGKITDLNSTGTIQLENNTNVVAFNANCGSEDHPINSIVLCENAHIELTEGHHLHANNITLGNGATILPESMIHLTGGNIDINSDL